MMSRTGPQHFRLEILKDSLLPETRVSVRDFDLKMEFSEIPENVNISKSALYTDEQIPGRSEPWKVYNSSGATMIDFSAKLVATGEEKSPSLVSRGVTMVGQIGHKFGVGGLMGQAATYAPRVYRGIQNLSQDKRGEELTSAVYDEVIKKAAFLESLVYPQYNQDGIAFPPPLLNLRYGPLVRRGVIRDVRFRLTKPWDPITGMPMMVDCSVTMEEVNRVPKSHLQVRNFQRPETGSAGQGTSVIPFKSKVLGLARSTFGL
jgi:hypothetical protein